MPEADDGGVGGGGLERLHAGGEGVAGPAGGCRGRGEPAASQRQAAYSFNFLGGLYTYRMFKKSWPIHMVSYYIKLVKTSWTDSTLIWLYGYL